MKRYFSFADLASIAEASAQLKQSLEPKQESKQVKPKRKRVHTIVHHYVGVTSSDKRTAFWMNLANKDAGLDFSKDAPKEKQPYVKFFGEFVKIKESDMDMYIKAKVQIYWK